MYTQHEIKALSSSSFKYFLFYNVVPPVNENGKSSFFGEINALNSDYAKYTLQSSVSLCDWTTGVVTLWSHMCIISYNLYGSKWETLKHTK